MCSHPNDDDPMFRIPEDQIFSEIFKYIEVYTVIMYIVRSVSLYALTLCLHPVIHSETVSTEYRVVCVFC